MLGLTALAAAQPTAAARSADAFWTFVAARYLAEPCTNVFVRVQRAAPVTLTVNVVVTVRVLPARSVAMPVLVTRPGAKPYAGALTPWHGVAIPERASLLAHVKATV